MEADLGIRAETIWRKLIHVDVFCFGKDTKSSTQLLERVFSPSYKKENQWDLSRIVLTDQTNY